MNRHTHTHHHRKFPSPVHNWAPIGNRPFDRAATNTHTHTNTLVSEINFNSLVREQISRQPFISSASSTLPLHCTLLFIDPRHSLVVRLSHTFAPQASLDLLYLPSWLYSSNPRILSLPVFPLTRPAVAQIEIFSQFLKNRGT